MPATSSFRITSGMVSESTRCRVSIEPENSETVWLHLDSPKFKIDVCLVGAQLSIIRHEIDAALEQSREECETLKAELRAVGAR
jgi:hypothetical protein